MAVALIGIVAATARLSPAHAAGNTILVNSTADTTVAGDSICTLREAIDNVNAASDTTSGDCVTGTGTGDTIHFTITGAADFTGTQSHNGYTIAISTPLPTITQALTIDGYSQSNAAPNTAVSPAPFNGELLIQVDGTSSPAREACFKIDSSSGVTIRGLVISNCGGDGVQIHNSSDATVQGNYIGTDPTGLINEPAGHFNASQANGSGVEIESSLHTTIGGTDPAQRNLISGNQFGDLFIDSSYSGSDPSAPAESQYTTVQGNYFGLAADGLTAMPCGYDFGHGNSFLITHSANDLFGGTATGAGNVLATSSEFGISLRDGTYNETIQGNYIGTDYTGNASPSHSLGTGQPEDGISIGTVSGGGFHVASHDILIGGAQLGAGNVISGNSTTHGSVAANGIGIHDGGYNVTAQGNKIGIGADGTTSLGNQGSGIAVSTSGSTYIHDSVGNLIGGTTTSEANIIANNSDGGVDVFDDPTQVAILGNSIHDNTGLGIDLQGGGVTANDSLDTDAGPNGLLNFPEYTGVAVTSGNTTIDYNLDVPAGSYRIEFFKNTTPDPSGNGEGKTYLGHQDITSTGTGTQTHSYTLVGVTGVTNLATTTTAIDTSAPGGFGPTSEFGNMALPVTDLALTNTLVNPQDVAPGASLRYDLTLTNNGLSAFDLTNFDGSGPNLFATSFAIIFLPPAVTYVSSSNSSISCTDLGSTNANVLVPNHPGESIIQCVYTGSASLAASESISTSINVTVNTSSPAQLASYAITGWPADDPDLTTVQNGLYSTPAAGGSGDFIDYINANPVNNFAVSNYTYVDPAAQRSNPTIIAAPSVPETGTAHEPLIVASLCVLTGLSLLAFVAIRRRSSKFVFFN